MFVVVCELRCEWCNVVSRFVVDARRRGFVVEIGYLVVGFL